MHFLNRSEENEPRAGPVTEKEMAVKRETAGLGFMIPWQLTEHRTRREMKTENDLKVAVLCSWLMVDANN